MLLLAGITLGSLFSSTGASRCVFIASPRAGTQAKAMQTNVLGSAHLSLCESGFEPSGKSLKSWSTRGLVSPPARKRVASVTMPWGASPALWVGPDLTNIVCRTCKLHADVRGAVGHFKGLSAPIGEQLTEVLP